MTWKLQGRLWSHDKSRPVSTAVPKEQCHNSRDNKLTTVTTEITNSRKPRTAKLSKKKKNKQKKPLDTRTCLGQEHAPQLTHQIRKRETFGTWEDGSLVKCLPSKHKDLSLDPQNPSREPQQSGVCLEPQLWCRVETGGSLTLLASRPQFQ